MDRSKLSHFDTYHPPTLTEVTVAEFPNEPDADFKYAHFTAQPGAEIDLTGRGMTGKTGREHEAFDLNDSGEPLIGFLCKDNDGQSFMLAVSRMAGEDVVYRERRDKQGDVIRDVQTFSGFYDDLTAQPLIIGSRPSRFGGNLKLVGVLAAAGASHDVLESNVEGQPSKQTNPLATANAYLLEYLRTHP